MGRLSKGREPSITTELRCRFVRDPVVDVDHDPLASVGQVHGIDSSLVEPLCHKEFLDSTWPRINGCDDRSEVTVAKRSLVYGTQGMLFAFLEFMEHPAFREEPSDSLPEVICHRIII